MSEATKDLRPPMPTNFSWCSVCSGHSCQNPEHPHIEGYCPNCGRCNAGRWVNDEFKELDHWLYTHDPDLWRKWANRETTPDQPGHAARHFLESIFPNLRRDSAAGEKDKP